MIQILNNHDRLHFQCIFVKFFHRVKGIVLGTFKYGIQVPKWAVYLGNCLYDS